MTDGAGQESSTPAPLAALSAAGVSIWLDDLSREWLDNGRLAQLITQWNLSGVTTNPTIFAAALTRGDAYDAQLRALAARGASVPEAVRQISVADVAAACAVFAPVWEASDGTDGRVSLEVDPGLAYDTEATVDEAIELWKAVDRPNLLVKIPATPAGLPAITRTLAAGISVNVTLIFSVRRYREVMQAFLAGLDQAAANGHRLDRIASVASFFVSRVDAEIDGRLDTIGTREARALRGQAGIANSRLAYAAYQDTFTGKQWAQLSALGARPQRPLWASTGVKNPDYPDTMYVDELVVDGTVCTMPEPTLRAVADHAQIRGDTVTGTAAQAQRTFDALDRVGVDLPDVFDTLETQGVDKFATSWSELGDTVRTQLEHHAPR